MYLCLKYRLDNLNCLGDIAEKLILLFQIYKNVALISYVLSAISFTGDIFELPCIVYVRIMTLKIFGRKKFIKENHTFLSFLCREIMA